MSPVIVDVLYIKEAVKQVPKVLVIGLLSKLKCVPVVEENFEFGR